MKKIRLTKTHLKGLPMRKRWLYEDETTKQPCESFFIVKGKKLRLCDIV
jgi:hypothetical protein